MNGGGWAQWAGAEPLPGPHIPPWWGGSSGQGWGSHVLLLWRCSWCCWCGQQHDGPQWGGLGRVWAAWDPPPSAPAAHWVPGPVWRWGPVGAKVEQSHGSCGQVCPGSFWSFSACSQTAALQGESQILPRNGTPVTTAGMMPLLCSQLRDPSSAAPAPSTSLLWAWRKNLIGLGCSEQLMLGESSGPGRGAVLAGRRGFASVSIPSLGIFFWSHQIFKLFLFQAGLEAPCTASEGSVEPCSMPFKRRQLQSGWKWRLCLCLALPAGWGASPRPGVCGACISPHAAVLLGRTDLS